MFKKPQPQNLNPQSENWKSETKKNKGGDSEKGKERGIFYMLFALSGVLMIRKPVMLVSIPLNTMELYSDVDLLVSGCIYLNKLT